MNETEPMYRPRTPPIKRRAYRPFGYRLLIYGLVVLAVMGWLRVGQTIALWLMLTAVNVWPGPIYLVFSGSMWGVTGLVAAIGLWVHFRWARTFTIATALFMAASYWIDRLLIVRSTAARANLPFAVLMTILLLVYMFAILRGLPRFRRFRSPKL